VIVKEAQKFGASLRIIEGTFCVLLLLLLLPPTGTQRQKKVCI
jgi:hypothetical protein